MDDKGQSARVDATAASGAGPPQAGEGAGEEAGKEAGKEAGAAAGGPGVRLQRLRAARTLPIDDVASMRVLVADDNTTNRLVLAALLGRLGIEPLSVDGGLPAVRAVERERFDLLLLDIFMPDLDGIFALRRMREILRARGEAPVFAVAVTGTEAATDHRMIMAAGFDFLCPKPVSLDDMRALFAAIAVPMSGSV
ncbi:MAG: response regulator [Pseudomonadota bacterium]